MYSSIAFRDFERAVERLKVVSRCLTGDAQKETLGKIKIAVANDFDASVSGVKEVAAALGEAIHADLSKYVATTIINAQDAVKEAAAALHEAIDRDLKINEMRD